MKPEEKFLNQPKEFWAAVRSLGQHIGYTDRKTKQIKVPTVDEMRQAFTDLKLKADQIGDNNGTPTALGKQLQSYFQYRSTVLHNDVEPKLMDVGQARKEFDALRKRLKPKCPIPMNKQKGKKKKPAYLTGIVNMLIEANSNKLPCDYDPRELTTVTRNGLPIRTLARRIDGAFTSTVNPVAVWEIKEYYFTTTFGSRVADGVYETLLDGVELAELRDSEKIDIKHYLFVDSHFTWWECGRSYLCRIIDMLHMGYVDEVLFGKEVLTELPRIVGEWVKLARKTA